MEFFGMNKFQNRDYLTADHDNYKFPQALWSLRC